MTLRVLHRTSAIPVLSTALSLLFVGCLGSANATAAPATEAAAATRYAYSGDAYGTRVVDRNVTSGRSAPVVLGCTTQAGLHKSNTVANVNASPVLTSGAVFTNADTFASPTKSRTTATVENVNLLDGAITATAVRSQSNTSGDGTGFRTSDDGTSFVDLSVLGTPIAATVAPNTRINLPDVGYVVLNEQVRKETPNSASLTVNAIHLVITQGVRDGTDAIVAHATSGLHGPIVGPLYGFAYGSRAKVGNAVTSGPSFRQIMPCLGTNGNLRVNTGAGVSLPDVFSTGAIRNTARGTVNASTAKGETTSTVDRANVLNRLVQANVIKADAHASSDGNAFTGLRHLQAQVSDWMVRAFRQ